MQHSIKYLGTLVSVMAIVACVRTDKISPCNTITEGVAFTAQLEETWCLNGDELRITLDELIDDSRCNFPGVECVWAGKVTVAATFEYLSEVQRDTFNAINMWQDTLQIGAYDIRLVQVYPEIRDFSNPTDPEDYRFELVVE